MAMGTCILRRMRHYAARAVTRAAHLAAPPPLVVVSGLPRSGTSWVAKVLAFTPGYTYYREPDNSDHVAGARREFRWLYLPSGRHDPAWDAHMRRALRGRVATPFTMQEDPGPLMARLPLRVAGKLGATAPFLYLPKRRTLVKLVHANLALEWIADEFPAARQVHVMRHPCGTFASWARLGWEPEPRRLLGDDRLVGDHLAPFVDVIEGAGTFWQRAGALWGAIYTVVHAQLPRHQDWCFVQHEWLCADPVTRCRRLFDALGLRWTKETASFLRESDRPGDDAAYSLRRSAAAEIDKWKSTVDPSDVAACREVVEAFDLPYYRDFEPVPGTPAWAT